MIENIQHLIENISISKSATIREAMQAVDRGAIGLALLVNPETNQFAGLVTDGDIRRALLGGLGLESIVDDVPRPTPKTAPVNLSIEQISTMFSQLVRVVPILNEEQKIVDLAIFDRRVRIPVAEPNLGEKELSYVSECILTGWVSSAGKFVTKFEEMFAEFCGTKYAIATSNGTTALHLALLSLDIGPGDEVIVPTFSFIASANAVVYTGATPVFVDSEKHTWNINPELIEAAITPKTKAIMPVHIYGNPANMNDILDIAKRYNLAVIEDAAEAHGARYNNKVVGSIGDIGTFSFYGNKIVTTGEGGMVVTNREDLAHKIRILRDHGMSRERRYWHPVLGFNYRLTNIQAALGVAQMEKIETILGARQQLAQIYDNGLKDISGITTLSVYPNSQNVCWLYSILIDEKLVGKTRNDVMNALKNYGIDTRPLFPPIHTQPIYATGQSMPVAEALARNGLSLPSSTKLSQSDLNHVIVALHESI